MHKGHDNKHVILYSEDLSERARKFELAYHGGWDRHCSCARFEAALSRISGAHLLPEEFRGALPKSSGGGLHYSSACAIRRNCAGCGKSGAVILTMKDPIGQAVVEQCFIPGPEQRSLP